MKKLLKYILPAAILLAGGAIAFVMVKNRRQVIPQPREIPVPLVRAVALEPQEHRFKIRAQGSVSPRTEINMVSEVVGRIVAVAPSFAAGGFFEAGDVLATIDARDYELAATRARAVLAEARVRLQREEAESAVARKEWDALGRGAAPGPLLLREPQLAEARASVESAQATLQQTELDLERCRIKAPFAGRVWNKKADIGQFVTKGEVLARIYAVDYAEVRLPLPLDETAYLDLPLDYRGEARAPEQPRVTLRARFGAQTHEWEARIVRVEGEVDPRSRMITAVARVEDPYARNGSRHRPPLAVGLFVEAEIEGKSAGKVFIAPRAALRGESRIMAVDPEHRLRFRPVEVVRLERDQAILRGGLQPGDLVCVSPLDAPVEGMRVRLISTNETTNAVGAGKENR